SRYRHFAHTPFLDRWIHQAHAANPLPTENIVFAFVKRAVSLGTGWWRVQILDRIVITEDVVDTFLLPAIGERFVTAAHAGIGGNTCVSERLYEALVEVLGNGTSAWATDVGSTDD